MRGCKKQLRPGAPFSTFFIERMGAGRPPPTPLNYFFSGVSGISDFRKKNKSRGWGVAAPRPSLQSKKSKKGGPGRICFSPLLAVKKIGKMGDSRVHKKVKIKIFYFIHMDEGRMSRETQKPIIRVVTPLQLFATSKTGQKYVIVATTLTVGF